MKKVFNVYMIILVISVLLWWLSRPFSDSHKDNVSYQVLTENKMVQELVTELAGPEIAVKSIQDEILSNQAIDEKVKYADLIILDGFNSNLLTQVREIKNKNTELLIVRDLISRSSKQGKVENYYWMSMKKWTALAYGLQLNLKREFPSLRSEINYRYKTYIKDIQTIMGDISKRIESIASEKKVIASYHPSIKVFADEFNIRYVDLRIKDVDDQKIKEKVKKIKENLIKTIITIDGVDSSYIDEVVKFVLEEGEIIKLTEPVHSLRLGSKESNIGTYKKLMVLNSDTIIDGMKN